MQLWRKHPGLLRAAALLVSATAALLPAWWEPESFAGIEETAGDVVWRLGANSTAERRVVLVDIDEKSLQSVGAWPWPRSTMADLSVRLGAAGVRLQAYDVSFSDPRPGDEALSAAWAGPPTVVAQLFSLDSTITPGVGALAGGLASEACPPFAPPSFGFYGTASSLLEARPAVGHITPRLGVDGVVRHVPALICHDGRAYASLALTALWLAAQPSGLQPAGTGAGVPASGRPDWQWHVAKSSLLRAPTPFQPGLAPAAWLTSRSLPGVVVPLDAQGNMRVPYGLKRQAFAAVSAADVLQGRTDATLLRGAIVLVGGTAFGMGDTVATPHGAVASGLEVHAQSLVGLLDNNLPYTPARWPLVQGLLMAGVSLVLLVVAVRRRGVPAKRLPLTGLVLIAAVLFGFGAGLLQLGLWLPWLSLALFTLLASLSLATVEHALARAQRERLSAHLGAYLPAPVAARLMASEPSGSLQLEPRQVSVLVADIRNFTALATHGQPDQVAALLHAYCCQAVDVVERFGGVVENVVGDAILAVWRENPGADNQHPQQALAAAQELVRITRPLFAHSFPVTEHSLLQPLALGIGLESGVAIVGSFGPARRRAHAALGEPVSVANRIQQMTADLSVPIVVGPQLAALLAPEGVEPLGEYLLEGLAKHYQLFAPVGWADLAAVDSNWATSAAGSAELQVEAEAFEWSRWGEVSRPGRPPPSTLRVFSSLGLVATKAKT